MKIRHLAIALISGAIFLSGGLEPVERQLMDLRFRLLRRSVEAPVAVVAIDPRSLELLSVWPWPRGYHATVLERLLEAGATRVAFDLDFSSHSVPEEDDTFALALAAAGDRAILPVIHRWQNGVAGNGTLVTAVPLPSLGARATIASINIRPESDGLVRRYWPIDSATNERTPSLALALLPGLSADRQPFHLDFALDTASIGQVSYVDVLTGQFDPATVRGRGVIVGATAVELGDQVAVPVRVSLAGPNLQALAAACLHTGRSLHRAPPWLPLSIALLLGWLAGEMIERMGWRRGLLVLTGSLTALMLLSIAAQLLGASLLDISPAGLTLSGAYVMGLVRRIDTQGTHLVTQAAKVRSTEARMRHVVENSFDAIITVSEAGRIETFNRAAERMFGREAYTMAGARIEQLVPGGFAEKSPDEAATPRETTGVRADGERFPIEITVTAFDLDGRVLRVGFLRDITSRKAQQDMLRHQASHDALTDLPNRVMLQRRAVECLETSRLEKKPSAFLILDLDRFKEVNDTLGHVTGDRLLEAIARRLCEPLRPGDTLARIGGDEFAVILPGADLAQARIMAERLTGMLKTPFDLQGLRLQVDTSVGIALFPDHGTDPGTLLQRGDVAMYQAKKLRNTVAVYDPQQDFSSVRHLTLRGELQDAIEKGHLLLHYQPKVSARTGRIEGVEALVRWQHPRHGLLPPDEFIPVAENTGLIRPMTAWVLDAALKQCARWSRQGLRLSIAVNCSARNLLEDDLTEVISRKLAACGLPAEHLILELTETAIIEDPSRSLKVLTALAELGVRLSIDDFGTGYSSLEQLRRLPARELKIDKSFVIGMDRSEGNSIIVRSTIDLAHNLGLQAVAEGVESEPVWTDLRRFGCDLGQGFHIARPLPAEALEKWIADTRREPLSSETLRSS